MPCDLRQHGHQPSRPYQPRPCARRRTSHLPQHAPPYARVQQIAEGYGCNVEAAKGNGRGFDANLQIIVAINHRVFGIVGNHPKQIAHYQPQRLRGHMPLGGCIGHGNAPAKGQPQHGLRYRDQALGKRVGHADEQRRKGIQNGGQIGAQHQQKCQKSQCGAHGQRLFHADATAGHGAVGRAFDVAVKIAVGHVVDAAAGAAHQDGAQRKHRQQMPTRKAPGRQPQRSQRRPQQQQPASRPIPADQVQIKAQARCAGRGSGRHDRHCRRGLGLEAGIEFCKALPKNPRLIYGGSNRALRLPSTSGTISGAGYFCLLLSD